MKAKHGDHSVPVLQSSSRGGTWGNLYHLLPTCDTRAAPCPDDKIRKTNIKAEALPHYYSSCRNECLPLAPGLWTIKKT